MGFIVFFIDELLEDSQRWFRIDKPFCKIRFLLSANIQQLLLIGITSIVPKLSMIVFFSS